MKRFDMPLFDDETATTVVKAAVQPADPPTHWHEWTKSVHVWPGETAERLVWKCTGCPEIRGRIS